MIGQTPRRSRRGAQWLALKVEAGARKLMELADKGGSDRQRLLVRCALFAAWCMAAGLLISRHVFWRDEVRALSIALSGETPGEMLQLLRGEGHPALWYLLLRGAHGLVAAREVLPAVATLIGATAMALLTFRSPFRPAVLALILFGAFGLYEYVVMARNYGISMLLLFALAERYPHWRDHPAGLGILLALLCNTNVHSVLLAGGFLLFWLIDISSHTKGWTRRHTLFVSNLGLAALGAVACLLTVFPSAHDAVAPPGGLRLTLTNLSALLEFGSSFTTLHPPLLGITSLEQSLGAVVVVGALLGLLHRPAAFVSALFVLIALHLLYRLVYPGSYRHEALLLVYLITMYWLIISQGGNDRPPGDGLRESLKRPVTVGGAFFILLLGWQLPASAHLLVSEMRGIPASRAADLGRLLAREKLTRAIVIGDPEVFLESLPYYAPNPIYLLREQRFGKVTRFTRRARLQLDLDTLLSDARVLAARNARPIVIVLQHQLEVGAPSRELTHTYVQSFRITPESVRRFNEATEKLGSLRLTTGDESYDVYLLR